MREGLVYLCAVSTATWILLAILSQFPAVQRWDERLLGSRGSGPSRDTGKRARKIETMMRDVTALGGDTILVLILFTGSAILMTQGQVQRAGQLAAILIAARGAGFLLKAIVERPRPGVREESVATFTSSFPSVHTLMSFVSVFALLFVSDASVILALSAAAFMAFAVGMTRLYFAVHWPSDVLAGWCGGLSLCSGVALMMLPGGVL